MRASELDRKIDARRAETAGEEAQSGRGDSTVACIAGDGHSVTRDALAHQAEQAAAAEGEPPACPKRRQLATPGSLGQCCHHMTC